MSLSFSNLRPTKGSKPRRSPKRVGRGNASGKGTTAGRGTKGQKARTGGRNKLKMLGIRRIVMATPKLRGFQSRHEKAQTVELSVIAKVFSAGAKITPNTLVKKGLIIPGNNRVKILGSTAIVKKLTVIGCEVSSGAKAAIEAQGGSVV